MMTSYALYLESGPKRRTTMVHVPALLGCVARGPTTAAALTATPNAIRAFLTFLARQGEPVEPAAPFTTTVVEHVTEGLLIGDGSPSLAFTTDFDPLDAIEAAHLVERAGWLHEALAAWADGQEADGLDAAPARGRTTRAVLMHVIGAEGAFLAAALGGAPGFGRLRSALERGELPPGEALRRAHELLRERVAAVPAARLNEVRVLESGRYTPRKALRRALEHAWEHLTELTTRPLDSPARHP